MGGENKGGVKWVDQLGSMHQRKYPYQSGFLSFNTQY